MSPEERAKAVMDDRQPILIWPGDPLTMRTIFPHFFELKVAAAIRAAVEEEREACAKIAQRNAILALSDASGATAAEIRARSS